MKRIGRSPDSLVPIYSSGYRTMFDGVDEEEEELVNAVDDDAFSLGGGSSAQKKRRLSAEQVRALEKNFEVENKLEPERKARLAQELDLQPRQVAVWFQNRRARWKTKQLERDFGSLKSRYDALRLDYDSLLRDKESLVAEVKVLEAKLTGEEYSGATVSESDTKAAAFAEEETLTLIYSKDGSSDSDSSAVLNDDNSPTAGTNGGGSGSGFGGSAGVGGGLFYHQQLMKVESGFLDGEEPCSFFSDDQPPVLPWYCGDGWEE